MTRGDLTRSISWVAVTSLLAAALLSQRGLVSVRPWAMVTAVIVVLPALFRLIAVAQVEVTKWTLAWWPIRRSPQEPGPIHDFRALEGIIRDALHNPRVHTHRLQPRLIALARHYLPISQGLDLDRDVAQTAALLDDLAWLIDPAVTGRSPTTNELDRFLNLVLDNTTFWRIATP